MCGQRKSKTKAGPSTSLRDEIPKKAMLACQALVMDPAKVNGKIELLCPPGSFTYP